MPSASSGDERLTARRTGTRGERPSFSSTTVSRAPVAADVTLHDMTDGSDKTPQGLFVRVLQAEPGWATILVTNGFTTLEEIAYVPIEELRSIEGLDEQRLQAWRARARSYLLVQIHDDNDEGEPLAATTLRPRKPNSGGSGERIE